MPRSAAPAPGVDPTGRGIQNGGSRENLGPGNINNNKPPPKNPKKPATYTGKANSKLKAGRSALTDAKFWVQKSQEDQALEDPEKRKMTLGSITISTCQIVAEAPASQL